MRKAVSNGKYTLFFEENNNHIECIAYETGKHMTVEEIAESFGVTRVACRNTLTRSLKKMYIRMKKKHKDMSPCEIISSMAVMFNINYVSEYKKFISLFPPKIRRELYETARAA